MLAAAALLWFFADASVESLSVTPPGGLDGPAVYAGAQIAKTVSPRIFLALTGRAGAAHVDDWRPVFEGTAEAWWRDAIGVHAGARHDGRLRREGELADFRDPTGRLFVGVTALPLRKGPFSAGASFDYERAMPGTGRLPAGVNVAAVARVRWRP